MGGTPFAKGLGFRFESNPKQPSQIPQPVGLDGLFESFRPPYFKNMSDSVDAVVAKKFGPNGTFNPDSNKPAPYLKRGDFLRQVPKTPEKTIQCTKDICHYIYDTFGRFPAYIDPMVIDSTGVDGVLYCGEPLLERLIGGRPDTHPEQLRQISPIDWLPWGLRQEYIISSRRYPVTPPRPLADGRTTMRMLDYPELSRGTGDPINVEIISDADHFDFTTPDTEAFEAVELAVLRVLESRDWAVVD